MISKRASREFSAGFFGQTDRNKMTGLFTRYLLARPGQRAKLEWSLLIASCLAGLYFPIVRLPCYFYLLPFGGLLLIGGFVIHRASHAVHTHAHDKLEAIHHLVTTGIYAKLRHPGYGGLILMYLGLSLAAGTLLALGVALILSIMAVLTAFKEEAALAEKFGAQYAEYEERVPWRFVPGLF
jgi:protein-S-isoprenylcysteine O-methyltransferase Ste14